MTELVVQGIGEIVSLDDPAACARALDAIRDLETKLREAKEELTLALVYESERQGSKTLHLDGVTAEVRGGTETVYDAQELENDLREAGMPEERIRDIVEETVTYRVRANEAKRAASANPVYAEIIARHSRKVPKRWSVAVSGP